MRVKLLLVGLTIVAVGGAYAVTHRHTYKNYANAEAAADFAAQVCATNSIMHIINAYPPANPLKTPSTPDGDARRTRLFRTGLPAMVLPMVEALKTEPTWSYLHDLGSRANDVSSKRVPDADLKKELTLFAKETAADITSLCPKNLPLAPEDQPYIPFAIVMIIQSLGETPAVTKAVSDTTAH